MRKDYEIEIRWTAFPLHPETPEEGFTIEELFVCRSVDIAKMKARFRHVAEEEGLPLGERTKTYNSRLAQELGKWAESKGKGDVFHKAVFRAYFVHGRNIGKIPELVDLAKAVGLSGEEARRDLEKRTFKQAVDLDWSRSRELGVTAIPTFLVDQRFLVGAQPYSLLEQLMKISGVKKRNAGP